MRRGSNAEISAARRDCGAAWEQNLFLKLSTDSPRETDWFVQWDDDEVILHGSERSLISGLRADAGEQ
jgi:hypothetical protein